MSSATAYQVIVKQLGEMAGGTIHAATSLPLNIPSRASRARASQLYQYAGKMRSKAFPAAFLPGWRSSGLLPLFRTMGPLLLDCRLFNGPVSSKPGREVAAREA